MHRFPSPQIQKVVFVVTRKDEYFEKKVLRTKPFKDQVVIDILKKYQRTTSSGGR